MTGNPDNPYELMSFAAATGRLVVMPLLPLIGRVRLVRRPQPGGSRKREGRAQLNVPEAVAKNIRGPDDERDIYLLVHIRREVYDEMNSPIIRPL